MLTRYVQESENARFGPCAVPFIRSLPLILVIVISISWIIGPAYRSVWPSWTQPFVPEYPPEDDTSDHAKASNRRSIWALSLALISVCACVLETALLGSSTVKDHDITNLVAWVSPHF